MGEKPAAIAGSLVNMRNVGTHKSVALTIHVQEEAAEAIIKAFGWATMTNPVPVAIARLNGSPEPEPKEGPTLTFTGRYLEGVDGRDEPEPVPREEVIRRARALKGGPQTAVKQAGIVCKEPEFWSFLNPLHFNTEVNEKIAAQFVRAYCGVKSRADITPGSEAEHKWNKLFLEYGAWRQIQYGEWRQRHGGGS